MTRLVVPGALSLVRFRYVHKLIVDNQKTHQSTTVCRHEQLTNGKHLCASSIPFANFTSFGWSNSVSIPKVGSQDISRDIGTRKMMVTSPFFVDRTSVQLPVVKEFP